MKKGLILLVLLFWFMVLGAQTLAKNDALKFDADYYLMEKDFTKALNNYLIVIKSEPENADVQYRLGICYLNSEGDKEKAISYLEKAVQNVSEKYNPGSFKETRAPIDAYFLLGSAYRVNNQLDKAIEAYSTYRSLLDPKDSYNQQVIEQYIRNCNTAKELQLKPVGLTAVNLGLPVNTALPNFNAVLSGDGNTLIYTQPARQGYDIFSTTFINNAWSTPKNITTVLGTGKYMKTTDLSHDGLTLVLMLDDPMNADIFTSTFSKGKWSKAEPLGKEINGKSNETHASLSNDGKVLYFTSDRKGGIGDKDIYRSELDEKGEWGKPVNLGEAVNTPFNEETPFVSDDGKRLYFSSEGHDGMGGYDIFRYAFDNPSAGSVNLGYPINTTDNDLFYYPLGENGSTAYYAFNGSDTYGGRDIYQVMVSEREEVEEMAVAEEVAVVEEAAPAIVMEEATPVSSTDEELAAAAAAAAAAAEAERAAAAIAEADRAAAAEAERAALEAAAATVAEEERAAAAEAERAAMAAAEAERAAAAAAALAAVEEPALETTPMAYAASSSAVSYKVQIMALKKPVDPGYFKGLTGLTLAYDSDKWYRYLLGSTTNRQEAERSLAELMSRGYRDAFIRQYGVVPRFTIQVMAVPGPVTDLSRFSNLPAISVTRGADNFCRYTVGEYETQEEALAGLSRIKELGYPQAFVARIKTQ